MPQIPRKDFSVRIPPHVHREMEALFEGFSHHLKGEVSNSDMVGALILRARRDRFGLIEDLAAYLDVLSAFNDGRTTLPD